jgi:hypothetical protein
VDAKVEALLAAVDEDASVNFQPCDISKIMQCLKLEKVCGFDGNQNECVRHLPLDLLCI